MMIALQIRLCAVIAPGSLTLVFQALALASKMTACAAALWLLLALPGMLTERDSTVAFDERVGAALLAHR